MATAYKMFLGPRDIGNFHKGAFDPAAAAKASELLQLNLDNWTIIFSGLKHNHIVHCILTIYALGATPQQMEEVYEREASYQKPRYPVDESVVSSLADRDTFRTHLGQQPHYSNYLLFFQREIESKGVKATLEEHIFENDEHSNRLLALIFNGIFHPYLHLGYALEFNQPALVAEALAMASVHDPDYDKMGPMFIDSEKLAGGDGIDGKKTLHQLMEEVRLDHKLRSAPNGENKIDRSKNVADHAAQTMIEYAAQYSLSEAQLSERMNELIDTCSLLIAVKPEPIGPSQPHKIDFFLLHSVNTLAMVPSLAGHPWLSARNATRLMEWTGRCHLLNYASQIAPPLTTAEIDENPATRSWDEVIDYAIKHPSDDGHLSKCIRSLAFGEELFSAEADVGVHGMKPGSWLRLANLVCDTVRWEAKTSPERWLLAFEDVSK